MNDKKEVKAVQSNIDQIKRVINRIAKTEDGRVFFNFLMQICAFASSSLVINLDTKEINTNSSLYNEARKTVYYEIRRLIDREILKDIEYLNEEENYDN